MGVFFKNNEFKTDYKKRPNDTYKAAVSKLDEETKKKIDRQRQIGMIVIVVFVFLFVAILAITGIGVDKSKSMSGNVFYDKESVLLECFGDSVTKGDTFNDTGVTYPSALGDKLEELFNADGNSYKCKQINVRNYGINGSILEDDTYMRLSGEADIVVILYTVNNFIYEEDYVGTLEANISTITQQGSKIFMANYPVEDSSEYADAAAQANNYISKAAESTGVTLVDLNSYFKENQEDGLFAEDGLHLTDKGYTLMGEYIAEAIHQYYLNQL